MSVGEFSVADCSKKVEYNGQLDKLWYIVKSNSSHQFRRLLHDFDNSKEILIEKGTVFKLGRISLRVRNLRLEGSESPVLPTTEEKSDSLASKLTSMYTL